MSDRTPRPGASGPLPARPPRPRADDGWYVRSLRRRVLGAIVAGILGGIVLVSPVALFLAKIVNSLPNLNADIVGKDFGAVKPVGLILFRDWLVPFEIVSILLLISLVGAVVLAGKRGTGK